MRTFHHIVVMCLTVGTLLTTCAMSSFAQTYTLTIQDGQVYVNGKIIEEDQVPSSLNTTESNMHLSFTGTDSPTFELNGRYYRIESEGLSEVTVTNNYENDETTVVFRNAMPARQRVASSYDSRRNDVMADTDEAANPNSMMQQYVFELSENTRELNEMSESLSQRRAQDLIQQVHIQAEQAARFAQDLPYLEMQQYMVDIGQRDQGLYQRLISELELEQETRQLAAEARALPEGEERDLKMAQLRELLRHILDLKQENRQREIDQLEEQLSLLKKRLAEREAVKERLIDRRIVELVGSTQ